MHGGAESARDAATAHSPKYYDVNLDSSVLSASHFNVYSLLYLSVRFALSSAANALSATIAALFRFRFRAARRREFLNHRSRREPAAIFTSRAADYGTELKQTW
jgi:hypothetical protein